MTAISPWNFILLNTIEKQHCKKGRISKTKHHGMRDVDQSVNRVHCPTRVNQKHNQKTIREQRLGNLKHHLDQYLVDSSISDSLVDDGNVTTNRLLPLAQKYITSSHLDSQSFSDKGVQSSRSTQRVHGRGGDCLEEFVPKFLSEGDGRKRRRRSPTCDGCQWISSWRSWRLVWGDQSFHYERWSEGESVLPSIH